MGNDTTAKSSRSPDFERNFIVNLSFIRPQIGTIFYLIISLVEPVQPLATHILHYVFMILVPHYHIYGSFHYVAMVYADKRALGLQDTITFGDYFRPENKVLFTLIIVRSKET